MSMEIVQSNDNKINTIDNKSLLTGYSFLQSERSVAEVDMEMRKNNSFYMP